MKIHFLKVCLASLVFSSAWPAFATITNFGSLTPPTSLNYGDSFASPVGQFFDDYLFSVPASEIGVFTSTVNAGTLLGINNLRAQFYKETDADITSGKVTAGLLHNWSPPTTNTTSTSGFTEITVINSTFLSAGDYILEIKGTVTGSSGGSYSGLLVATPTPVPEPRAYALMLAGLGLLGFVAGGKKQPDAA